MAWTEIHNNSEPDFCDDSFFGECPKFHKKAKVIVHTVGKKYCKTDLQNTYRKIGVKCSLLDDQYNCCLDSCPLVTEKY